jgi:tellurite resistance protein TehA-like permease
MKEPEDKVSNSRAPHILNASSNLLGICFVILTTLKLLNVAKNTIIDEIATIDIVVFTSSCLLSFLSLRKSNSRGHLLEKIADVIFIAGIGLLLVTAILFSLDIIS